MTKITKEELYNLANLSMISIDDKEIETLQGQIQTILTYLDQLEDISISSNQATPALTNVFRKDEACKKESSDLLSESPTHHDNYFSVPKILE